MALVSPEAAEGFPEIAGFKIFRILADERFGKFKRKSLFPDAFHSRKQKRARHTLFREHPPQNIFNVIVADEFVEHKIVSSKR